MCAMVCICMCVYTYILHLKKGDWVGRVNTEVRFHRGEALHDVSTPFRLETEPRRFLPTLIKPGHLWMLSSLHTQEMILEIILPREIFLHCLFWYNFNKCIECEIISSFHPSSENEIQFMSQSVELQQSTATTLQQPTASWRTRRLGKRTNNPLGAGSSSEAGVSVTNGSSVYPLKAWEDGTGRVRAREHLYAPHCYPQITRGRPASLNLGSRQYHYTWGPLWGSTQRTGLPLFKWSSKVMKLLHFL